ncbi:MAG: hypothetical protein HZB39_12870 [Planctomycetes bacterium]|nr:hypothetical protein [Planctomycetota bacterium]
MNEILNTIEALRIEMRCRLHFDESHEERLGWARGLLERSDEHARCEGLRMLATCDTAAAEDLLLAALESPRGTCEREVAVLAARAHATSERVKCALLALLRDIREKAATRAACVWSLRAEPDERVLAEFRARCADGDEIAPLRELIGSELMAWGFQPELAETAIPPAWVAVPERTREALADFTNWLEQAGHEFRLQFQRVIEFLSQRVARRLEPSFATFGAAGSQGARDLHVDYFPGADDRTGLPPSFSVTVRGGIRCERVEEGRRLVMDLDPSADLIPKFRRLIDDGASGSGAKAWLRFKMKSEHTIGERDEYRLMAKLELDAESGRARIVAAGGPGSVPTLLERGLGAEVSCTVSLFGIDPIAFADPKRAQS